MDNGISIFSSVEIPEASAISYRSFGLHSLHGSDDPRIEQHRDVAIACKSTEIIEINAGVIFNWPRHNNIAIMRSYVEIAFYPFSRRTVRPCVRIEH